MGIRRRRRARATWIVLASGLFATTPAAYPALAQSAEVEPSPTEPGAVARPVPADGAESWADEPAVEAPATEPAPGSPDDSGSPNYVIGAADVVRVTVWRNPELSAEVPVRPDGRISVPLLGDLPAAGLTTGELRERIAAGLSDYITAPDVTVIILQVNSKVVFLVGEVVRPAAVPLNREMRVLDAIAVAGGFSPFADRDDIQILRPQPDGSVQRHEFNFGRFVKGKNPESNMLLQSGDTIVVPD